MPINYSQFIRINSPKPKSQINNAPIVNLNQIVLPRESVLHYIPVENTNSLYSSSGLLSRNWPTNIRHYFMNNVSTVYGGARLIHPTLNRTIRAYYKENPSIKRVRDLKIGLNAPQDLLVLDYSLLSKMAVYRQSVQTPIWFYQNMMESLISGINQVPNERPQFVQINLTGQWLSYQKFTQAFDKVETGHIHDFKDMSLLWVLELFRYVEGAGSLLDRIQPDQVVFSIGLGLKGIEIPLSVLKEHREMKGSKSRPFYALLTKLIGTMTESSDADDSVPDEDKEAENAVPSHILDQLDSQVQAGILSPAQRSRYVNGYRNMQKIESPFTDETLVDFSKRLPSSEMKVTGDLDIPVDNPIVPKQALHSTATTLKLDYIKKLYQRDIAKMVLSLGNGGVVVKNYQSQIISDALEDTQLIQLNLSPIVGRDSTINFSAPVILNDGTFMVGGVHYTMDIQKVDQPIRKTKFNQAALTSYAGKIFISRSKAAKNSYNRWLSSTIRRAGINNSDKRVTSLHFGGHSVPNISLPRDYTALMSAVTGFVSGDYVFDFNYPQRIKHYGQAVISNLEKRGSVVCGTYKGKPIAMDADGKLIGPGLEGLNLLDTLGGFGIPPRDVAVFKSGRRQVPVVMFLGYLNGLTKLIKKIKTPVRYEKSNQRPNAGEDELFVTFDDERIYFKLRNPVESMIWSGLKLMESVTKSIHIADFDGHDGWDSCLSVFDCGNNQPKKWEYMNTMFLDPITIECLEDMHEPTNLQDLFMRCVDLIKDDAAPDAADTMFTRERGLEQIPGAIYKLFYDAIYAQKCSPGVRNQPISIPPHALLQSLNNNSTVQLVSEINPIHACKEQESVTMSGTGGRAVKTLVKRNRIFNEHDLGILSENTPDSSKVGIRGTHTPNAAIVNLRGFPGKANLKTGASGYLSTTGLLLPDMDRDDGKRMNLAAIQQSSIVPVAGSRIACYITGYNEVIASRGIDFFVFRAKDKGQVIQQNGEFIQVEYESKQKDGYKLGVKHGKSGGAIIPHRIISDKKVGDTFQKGDVLAWNRDFFSRDMFNPRNVWYLTGVPAMVALKTGNDMLEDGSVISDKFRSKLGTNVGYQRSISIEFSQEVTDVLKVGSQVEYTDPLMVIEEAVSSEMSKTNESIEALSKLGNQTPKAEHEGTISRIEVFYQGEFDDMSDSLKALVNEDTKRRKKEAAALHQGSAKGTCLVKKQAFIGDKRITPGKVIVLFHIDHALGFGAGDKQVTGNQLKSIPGRIMNGVNKTEDGQEIDVLFGTQSVNNRIVWSILVSGVFSKIIDMKAREIAKDYLSGQQTNIKTIEKDWAKFIDDTGLPGRNKAIYAKWFSEQDKETLVTFFNSVMAGDSTMPLMSFNMSDEQADLTRAMALGEKMGVKWYQRLYLTDPLTKRLYLSTVPYLVLQSEVRRQVHHLIKKRSTAKNNRVVDQLTGQVTGDSKASSLSMPELVALNAKGVDQAILECIKVRGGDDKAYRSMASQIAETGGFSLKPIMELDSRPKVLTTIRSLLHGAMLDSTI